MQVEDIQGDDVICTAANHANLDGLVTIFHTERSPDMLNNVQNDLPIMTSDDKARIKEVAAEFEIDFISLSFTRSGEDVQAAREFLDSMNMQTTKVCGPPRLFLVTINGTLIPTPSCCTSRKHAPCLHALCRAVLGIDSRQLSSMRTPCLSHQGQADIDHSLLPSGSP